MSTFMCILLHLMNTYLSYFLQNILGTLLYISYSEYWVEMTFFIHIALLHPSNSFHLNEFVTEYMITEMRSFEFNFGCRLYFHDADQDRDTK